MAERATKVTKNARQKDCPVIGSDKPVKLTVPKILGAKVQTDQFISVNGKNYLIQRGKEVTVPKNVRDEYRRSQQAQEQADKYYYEAASD